VQPEQRWLAPERTYQQRDMFLPVIGRAERYDLRGGHVYERQLRARHDFDGRLLPFADNMLDRDRKLRSLGLKQPYGRLEPRGARKVERGAAGLRTVR